MLPGHVTVVKAQQGYCPRASGSGIPSDESVHGDEIGLQAPWQKPPLQDERAFPAACRHGSRDAGRPAIDVDASKQRSLMRPCQSCHGRIASHHTASRRAETQILGFGLEIPCCSLPDSQQSASQVTIPMVYRGLRPRMRSESAHRSVETGPNELQLPAAHLLQKRLCALPKALALDAGHGRIASDHLKTSAVNPKESKDFMMPRDSELSASGVESKALFGDVTQEAEEISPCKTFSSGRPGMQIARC